MTSLLSNGESDLRWATLCTNSASRCVSCAATYATELDASASESRRLTVTTEAELSVLAGPADHHRFDVIATEAGLVSATLANCNAIRQ